MTKKQPLLINSNPDVFSHREHFFLSAWANYIVTLYYTSRSTSFKEDEGTWKENEDGKVINKQPQRVIEGPNNAPQGGYIVK